MKLHLAIDLDDVVLDFMEGVRHSVQTEYDVVIPPYTQWELSEVLDPIIGRSWWDWMRERDWLWPNFPAVPGAIGGLTELRDDGHFLECVTAKPEWAEAMVWKWLGKWRPPFHRVTIVGMEDAKCDATSADVLVDDKFQNILDFGVAGGVGILFDRAHNQDAQVSGVSGLYRASGWHEVVELIRQEGDSW